MEIFTDLTRWTIPDIASRQVEASGEKLFVQEVNGACETYAQFWRNANQLAAYFIDIGVCPGDRLVILASNGIPALHVWMATALVGAIDVSVNTSYRGEPLRHVLSISDPSMIVAEADFLATLAEIEVDLPSLRHLAVIGDGGAAAEPSWLNAYPRHAYHDVIESPDSANNLDERLPAVRPSDIATVIFTSGTTGPSKGVLMPHAQVCLIALQAIEGTRMQASDTFYSAHPLFHIAGKFMGVFAIFAMGGTLVLDQKFVAEAWLDKVREAGATVSIVHGPMIEMIYAQTPGTHDRDHKIGRLMCCPLPKGIAGEFQTRFGVTGVEMWGMTEIGCPCWTSLQPTTVPGSCGKVLTDWYDIAIVDPDTDEALPPDAVGEIVARPKQPWTIMQGYIGMPEASVEAWRNLWFHTGDAACRDKEGNVFFVDRLGDRVRRRAESIASYDIETTATRHPAIRECSAVGVPSGYEDDDDIMVFVVLKDGCHLDATDLLRFFAQALPHFMVPRYIETVGALPRTPTNKVKKKELRQRGVSPETWDRKAAGVSLRDL